VRLGWRRGNVNKSFAGLSAAIAIDLAGRKAVLDGETMYLGGDGRQQF